MRPLARLRWARDTWVGYRDVSRSLAIRPGEWVLDVGSGGFPFPRADVLCDRYTGASHHRHGREIVSDRPLVVADVTNLPFADEAFDVVICSHLLEHVSDPEAAIRELERVGRRGYIECPSASWEKLQGFPFHKWLVSIRDGGLLFEEKSAPLFDGNLRDWFTEFQRRLGIASSVWLNRRRLGVYTSLYWRDRIPRSVVTQPGGSREAGSAPAPLEPTDQESPGPALDLVGKLIRLHGRRHRAAPEVASAYLTQILRCPRCRGELDRTADGHACRMCGASFPLDSEGRPVLLVEDSKPETASSIRDTSADRP